MRGISLDEIVATTKIGTRLLRALEDEQFDLLPGGIFNKAYVRAYAKCVGIDEDEAVAAYLEAANERPPDTRVIAQQHASIHSDRPQGRSGFPVVPVFILLVVVAAGWGGWKLYQDHQRDQEARMAASPAEPATSASASVPAATTSVTPPSNTAPKPQSASAPVTTAAPEPAKTAPPAKQTISPSAENPAASPATGVAPAEAGNGASFEVVIRPKDPAWVSVKSDGKFVVRGIIRPPDVKTIRASNQLVFWTGNSGAVEVSFNGKGVPLPGGLNEQGVLVFDSHGVVSRPPATTTAATQ